MKFICIKDVHLSHRGPVSRLDDWQEAIFAKLSQVTLVAEKVGAQAVLIAGDLFHHKTRIAYGTVYRLMEWCWWLRKSGVAVLAIPGNHDEVHDRLDSIPGQPLGLLFQSGLIQDLSHASHRFLGADGHAGRDVVIAGVPYPDAKDPANYLKAVEARGQGGRAVLLAHCFASPAGGTCYGEPCLSYAELSALPFDAFFFGHDHADHGVTLVNGKVFINIGALSRGTIAKEDVARDIKLAILDVPPEGEVKVQLVKLKVAPASEVFDLSLKAQKDREADQIEQFVGSLSADLLAQTTAVPFRERVGAMDVPDVIRARVLAYIEAAEAAQ